MKYRKFGRLDWEISEISLGMFRLEDVVLETFDINERIATLWSAVDQGVNYINLGYPFYFTHPQELCAPVRKVLAGSCRDKVKLAINIPVRGITGLEDLNHALDKQLKWFGLAKVDFCILDGVNRVTWDKLKDIGVDIWCKQIVDSGRVEYLGLAFHDDAHYLKEMHDIYPEWAVVQMELSMLDYKHHPGVGGFAYTQQYGTAVVATDSTKAGRLLKNTPTEVQEIWAGAKIKRTSDEWCLRWTLNFPEVSSVLINLESVGQLKKYLSYIDTFHAGDADIWEMIQASAVREAYYKQREIQCTACRCCMPCSLDIDVPRILELYNDSTIFQDDRIPALLYRIEGHQDVDCTHCSLCGKSCPKHFPIDSILEKADKAFR